MTHWFDDQPIPPDEQAVFEMSACAGHSQTAGSGTWTAQWERQAHPVNQLWR